MFAEKNGPDASCASGLDTPERRFTRVGHIAVPAVVALAIGAFVLVTAGETLRKATLVEVQAVVFLRSETGAVTEAADRHTGGGRRPTVQAPGWLEADPF